MVGASLVADLFVPQVSLLEKVLRALLVFVFLIAALRLRGKRELGRISVLDLAVDLADVDLIVLQPNGHLAIMGREAAGRRRAGQGSSGSAITR